MEATESSGTVTTGPATFAEAFAADASSASTPAAESPQADSASADATVPPASETPTDGSSPQQGEPPRERWDAILSNAREKAAAEARQQLEQQYAWANDPQQRAAFDQAVKLGQLYSQDRAGYVRQMLAEAMTDPTLAPAIRSEAGRLLREGRVPQAEQEPQPDLPIQLEDGRVVRLYSAEQQAKREAWVQQRMAEQLEQKFAPAMQTAQQFQALQQRAQQAQEAQIFATSFGQELSSLPHFNDLKAEIRDQLAKTHLASDHPAEVKAAALRIYTHLLSEKVLPGLSQKAETQLLDKLQQKAAASSSVNPGSAAPATPRRVTSFHELGPDAWK